jgi:hypothetical protein
MEENKMKTKPKVEQKKTEVKKQPETKFRSGALQLTVWSNEAKRDDGEVFNNYTFDINRSYKDEKGEWKQTHSFRKRDISSIDALMNRARDYLCIDEDEETEDIE